MKSLVKPLSLRFIPLCHLLCGDGNHLSGSLGRRKDLLGTALDDATRHGETSRVLEVEIHLASSLATLVDAPEISVSMP